MVTLRSVTPPESDEPFIRIRLMNSVPTLRQGLFGRFSGMVKARPLLTGFFTASVLALLSRWWAFFDLRYFPGFKVHRFTLCF